MSDDIEELPEESSLPIALTHGQCQACHRHMRLEWLDTKENATGGVLLLCATCYGAGFEPNPPLTLPPQEDEAEHLDDLTEDWTEIDEWLNLDPGDDDEEGINSNSP